MSGSQYLVAPQQEEADEAWGEKEEEAEALLASSADFHATVCVTDPRPVFCFFYIFLTPHPPSIVQHAKVKLVTRGASIKSKESYGGFTNRSLFLFGPGNRFRRIMIDIMQSFYFSW